MDDAVKPEGRRSETLLIQSDAELRKTIKKYLQERGIDAYVLSAEDDASAYLAPLKLPLTILDIDVERGDGFALIEKVVAAGSRCLVVSRHAEAADRIRAFALGADAYMAKPLDLEELYLRVRNVHAAVRPHHGEANRSVANLNGVKIDLLNRILLRPDGEAGAELTEAEFHMLLVLTQNMGRVVSREELFTPMREGTYAPLTRALDVGVSRLRNKLKSTDAGLSLRSVRQAGYLLLQSSEA